MKKHFLLNVCFKGSIPEILFFIVSPFLCLMYSVNNIIKNRKRFIPYFFVAVFLAFIAFLTLPSKDMDLYRHYGIINNFIAYKTIPFHKIFDYGYPFTVSNTIYCYLIAKTGIPNLYVFFTVLLVYMAIFYILIDTDGYNRTTGYAKMFILVILFTLSFYRLFVFSVRNTFVFVVSYLLCILFLKKNKINIYAFAFAFIFLIFFHPACLCIFFIYFLSNIKLSKALRIISMCIFLLYRPIVYILFFIVGSKKFFLLDRMYMYFNVANRINLNYFILYMSILVTFLFLIIYYYKANRVLPCFDLYCICLIASVIFNFDLLNRFIVLIVLMLPKYLIFFLNNSSQKLKKIILLCFSFIILAAVLGDIAGIRYHGWSLMNNGRSIFFNKTGFIVGIISLILYMLLKKNKGSSSSCCEKKNILFLINNLNGGGAEKILVETVRLLDKRIYNITVMTIINRGVYLDEIKKICNYKYIFDEISASSLILKKFYYSAILRFFKFSPSKVLYKIFIREKYNYEIAFLEGTPTKLIGASSNNESLKFAWVHADLINLPVSTKQFISLKQEINTYKNFDKILCVSSQIKASMQRKYDVKEKAQVQLNILDENNVIYKSNDNIRTELNLSKFNIITLGRLSAQKGYLRLLKVCNKLRDACKNFKLTIVGEGEERCILEKYIKLNCLEEVVELKGFIANPYPYLKRSDLFICSSVAEGFSTAVSEAVILGVPIITTDCAGMLDILGNSEYGMIVDNSDDALYLGLKEMLTDRNVYCYYKNAVLKRQAFFSRQKRLEELNKLLGGNI